MLPLLRQRGPDCWRDGGEKSAGGQIRYPGSVAAHAADECDSGAHVIGVGGGQDDRLHVWMEGIPRRRSDNPVGMVRRRAQNLCDRCPRGIHMGGRRQARQCVEIIPFGAVHER